MSALTIPTQSAKAQLSYQQLDNLHALRGFCSFYVVIYHAKYILWSGGTEYLSAFPRINWKPSNYIGFATAMASSAGFEMVIFFFVLSGFFIRYATLRKPRSVVQFYINRIVRIYPPYLVSMLLAAAVLLIIATQRGHLLSALSGRELNGGLLNAWQALSQHPIQSVSRTLVFLGSNNQYFGYNNVYWSLLPEALFYCIVPFAFRKANEYYLLSVVLYIIGVFIQIQHIGVNPILQFFLYYNCYFALGSWLYDLLVNKPSLIKVVSQTSAFVCVSALFVLLLLNIGLAALHLRLVSAPLSALLAILSILVLLAGQVNRQNVFVRLFHWIGLYSFSLYLYHFPLLLACYAMLTAFTGSIFTYDHWYLLFIPIVTLCCYALYWVSERLAVQYFRGL